jgi:16S rRNA (guanine527-N7)-methyltransferase
MTTSEFTSALNLGLNHLNIFLTEFQKSQLWLYQQILTKWNKTLNLTAHRNIMESLDKNFLDSLALAGLVEKDKKIMDFGSGGGFPGLVLKIVHPQLSITLVEVDRRKAAFLSTVIRELYLEEVEVANRRLIPIQDYESHHSSINQNSEPFSFDVIVSRATMNLEDLYSTTQPHLKMDGKILAMVSEKTEITNNWKKIKNYLLPFSKIQRKIVERKN